MHKKISITLLLLLSLVFGGTRLLGVTSASNKDREVSKVSALSAEPKKSNGFWRVVKSPFKGLAKLFGAGRDDGKPRRMTEKDSERFESAGLVRLSDSSTPTAYASDPKTITAREHLSQGRKLLEAGRLNDAIAELSTSTSLDPKLSQAHSLLAVAYEQKGLSERSRESHARALKAARNDALALNNSGYSLYLRGDYRGANDHLKRAAKLAPNDSRILNNLGLAQCRLGKFDDAFKNFTRAGGEYNGRINTATLLERADREVDAVKHYEAARRLQPNSPVVLQRLAELYERGGRNSDAEIARRALANPDRLVAATTTIKEN
ncbi:MAG: tetratricopeptide repeat protein [Acidobacteriota bacterium]|nr:tetratricopeptide repeat protein [Acidobacteriota bacterium]